MDNYNRRRVLSKANVRTIVPPYSYKRNLVAINVIRLFVDSATQSQIDMYR